MPSIILIITIITIIAGIYIFIWFDLDLGIKLVASGITTLGIIILTIYFRENMKGEQKK